MDILKDKSELIFFIHVGCLRNGHSIIFKSFKSHCAHCFDFMTHSFTTVTLTPVFSNFFGELVLSLREVLVNPFLLCMQDQKTDS